MHRQTIVRLLVILCLALVNAQAFAQRDRLSVEQFLDWEYVASPQISPDGKQIVYNKHWPDKINDKYEDEIWIMDADGGHNRFLVKGSQGRWAPDSKRLAYVAQGQPAGAQIFLKWIDLPGELDLRTPIEETEQYYRALKLRKVDTAMVRLADEYHGFNADFTLRHPSNRLSQILFLRGNTRGSSVRSPTVREGKIHCHLPSMRQIQIEFGSQR